VDFGAFGLFSFLLYSISSDRQLVYVSDLSLIEPLLLKCFIALYLLLIASFPPFGLFVAKYYLLVQSIYSGSLDLTFFLLFVNMLVGFGCLRLIKIMLFSKNPTEPLFGDIKSTKKTVFLYKGPSTHILYATIFYLMFNFFFFVFMEDLEALFDTLIFLSLAS
jgi:formate hydrogenlyase subunit 3/multisubunit Na+/H+ antiporter MnhD subunit